MKQAKVIGIGGVSRSGKSTLASLIEDSFDGSVLILSQDEFVMPVSEIPKLNDRTDWEHPSSLDFDRLKTELLKQKPNYDLIIVEGLLAFYNSSLAQEYDMKIFTEISYSTFIERRKQETRWGPEPEWYLDHVWKSFQKYGVPNSFDHKFNGTEITLSAKKIITEILVCL